MHRDEVARAQYHRLLSQGVDVRSYAAQLSRENDTLRPIVNYSQLLEAVATPPDHGAANNLKWAMALFALLLVSFVGAGAIMNDRPQPRAAAGAAAAPPPPAMPVAAMPVAIATPAATTAPVARPVVSAPPVVIAAPLQPATPAAVAPKATAPIAPRVKTVGFVRPAPRAATPTPAPVVRPDPPARPTPAATSDAAKREATRKKAMDTLVRASAETSL